MKHEQVHHKIITYIISWHTFNATSEQIFLHLGGWGWFCVGDTLCCIRIITIIISMDFRDSISCEHVVFDRWWYDEIGMAYEYEYDIDFSIFIGTFIAIYSDF